MLTCTGLGAIVALGVASLNSSRQLDPDSAMAEEISTVRFLALGDINLGRKVGQEILMGDTLYPFRNVSQVLSNYDIVFGNLECTLSDQKGETQHPRNKLIFTGPPAGGMALKRGGVTVVSTANNHALDYGLRAHFETMENLTQAGVLFAGTSLDSSVLYEPLIFSMNSIRFALFACTDIMNTEDLGWKRYVAAADTAKLLPRIRVYNDSVDVLIVSYHGGAEYTQTATQRTVAFAAQCINAGADAFLGHHPHVPHALEVFEGRPVAYSLGNFVFSQPFAEWTQKSFALSMTINKTSAGVSLEVDCLPLVSGFQPYFTYDSTIATSVRERVMGSLGTIQ